MNADFCNNLIYPIIYTTIGAAIGGLIAYSIARKQYSRDRLNETLGFIFLLNKTAGKIAKQSKEMSVYIEKFNTNSPIDSERFQSVVYEKHLEIDPFLLQLAQQ